VCLLSAFISVLSAAEPQAQPGCAIAPTGLVSWWPGDANDHDIVGSNSPTLSSFTIVPGEVSNGFDFAANGYLDVTASASLANQRFTWAAWVRPDGPGPNNDQYGSVIVVQNSDTQGDIIAVDWRSNPDSRFLFVFGDQASQTIYSADTFPAGNFYFVAATYNGAVFRLYVNGVLEASRARAMTIPYNSDPWGIGQSLIFGPGSNFRTWNGVIDEVQTYRRALTATELMQIYNVGVHGVCKGLTFAPAVLRFPAQAVGTHSTAMPVVIKNSFALPVAIASIAAAGDYSQTNNCPLSPATLAAGSTCTANVIFSPRQTGTRNGKITLTSSAPLSPQTIVLQGTGQ